MNVAPPGGTTEVPEKLRYDYYAQALASAMFPIQVGTRPSQPFGVAMAAAARRSATR